MDSRKILEIYKLINDRSIKPVNAWPSVSDIPPGMLVLDNGVVKIKVANELLTMEEFAIMLVKNGEAVTYNGQAILVDELNQIIYGDLL